MLVLSTVACFVLCLVNVENIFKKKFFNVKISSTVRFFLGTFKGFDKAK